MYTGTNLCEPAYNVLRNFDVIAAT
jgi:hypothetical protein